MAAWDGIERRSNNGMSVPCLEQSNDVAGMDENQWVSWVKDQIRANEARVEKSGAHITTLLATVERMNARVEHLGSRVEHLLDEVQASDQGSEERTESLVLRVDRMSETQHAMQLEALRYQRDMALQLAELRNAIALGATKTSGWVVLPSVLSTLLVAVAAALWYALKR